MGYQLISVEKNSGIAFGVAAFDDAGVIRRGIRERGAPAHFFGN
jgi:hypothetical protein